MQADDRDINQLIQTTIADESVTLLFIAYNGENSAPSLTANDARCIIECLRNNPRFHTLEIWGYRLHDVATLNVFRNGLPLCTSITSVKLHNNELSNEGLERLLPAFYNTSVRNLDIRYNKIQGQRGGEVIRDLLDGNNTVLDLNLQRNPVGPEGAIGMGEGIARNYRLQELNLSNCKLGNDGLANLILSVGGELSNNKSLSNLNLSWNEIEGTEGGRLISMLLQRFPILKELNLDCNFTFGPLGARALAPGLTLPNLVLERLSLQACYIGNEGVANLIPNGQVNRSLTFLNIIRISHDIDIQDLVGKENVLSLASRCTNLDHLDVDDDDFFLLSPDQQRRLNLLFERKRLHAEAQALGGSPPSEVFQKLVQANSHEHGLSASFVILRDYIFAEQHQTTMSSSKGERKAQQA